MTEEPPRNHPLPSRNHPSPTPARALLNLPGASGERFEEEWTVVRGRIATLHSVSLPRETEPAGAPRLVEPAGDEAPAGPPPAAPVAPPEGVR